MFFPRGGFAVDLEALEDLGVPPEEARMRVLGLGSLEYAVLAAGACACAFLLLFEHADAQRAVTLSWMIGVPAGTVLALIAVRYRDWICRGRLLKRILGPPLDAIAIVGQIVAAPRRHGFSRLHRDGGLLGRRGVRPLGLPRGIRAAHAVGRGRRRRLRDRIRADAADAAARRRGRGRGAASVRAHLGRIPLPAAVLAVFAYRVFNLWLPLGPAAAASIALRRRLRTGRREA